MNRFERKERIGHGGISELSRQLELSVSTVSMVVSDKTDTLSPPTIQRVQKAVAKRIGKPVDEVFPQLAGAA